MMVEAGHGEELLLLIFQELQELSEMSNEYANIVLVKGREGQDGAELYEQTEQVECSVDLRHWFVREFLEYVCVLHSFDFVEQLRAEHHIEVFQDSI